MSHAGQVEIESPTDEPRDLVLAGECTIRNAVEIAATLRERAGDLSIDARGVTGMDVAVLQLLVSARKSSAAKGCSMQITAPAGGALHLAIDRAGLGPTLRDVLVPDLA